MNELKSLWIDQREMPKTWEAMWDRLGILEGDSQGWNKGECWQYMGSKIEGDDAIHTFRHRCHPRTNQYQYRHIAIALMGEN